MNRFFRRGEKYFALLCATALWPLLNFAEVRLSVQPERSRGLPGELQKIELRIEMDSPDKAVLRIPHVSNLVLRAVERYPIVRSGGGGYRQRRQVVFQGVESGVTVMTNILVETGKRVCPFPPLILEVSEVEKAPPPGSSKGKIDGRELDESLKEIPDKNRGKNAP